MCGICGIVDFTGHAGLDPDLLTSMADTMVHRGPDDWGTYLSPDRCLGFGFRRLAIVDLSAAGHQPMSNENGTVWIVFNGEIYNHLALRRELEAAGHVYCSRADTESIIHGYEAWGEEVVHRLRGMFAFAIWDERQRRLFLARDRIGIKPLYYTQQKGCFLFGSEIKAILACPRIEPAVEPQALYHYLTLAATPPPFTLFREIRKLAPGHTLTVHSDGRCKLRQYWDPLFPDDSLEGMEEFEVAERLRELLEESIRLRMMSDVPFGVFLSGGIDSSLNVALMSELMNRPVDTFSVAVRDDARSNELSEARRVAEHYGASHHQVVITPQDFVDFLAQMVWHQDEPLADPVCVPLYFVSKLARDNGTIVVQVGEGSDELFAGYPGYAFMADFYRRLYGPFQALPVWFQQAVTPLATGLLSERKLEYVQRAASGQELFWGGATVFSEREKRRLMYPPFSNSLSSTHDDVVKGFYTRFDAGRPEADFLDRAIYLELKQRLPELLLMRVDKMTMANSVEARVPYLDHELVRFALSIPPAWKVRRGVTKHILKVAARGLVPDEVIDRPKTGFCGSASNMVRGILLDHAERSILNSGWLKSVLDIEQIRPRLAEHRAGKRDHGMAIWNLLNLVVWHQRWIEGRVEVELAAKPA
ncbi:asparagine synthase (glutamine-hydrolyzing) [Acidobacteria bacterium AH-259-A15]|nr:asparagine synthase (glutamine-hydrolyzing) [Acidobacteria bacterium AH-259-A15]